MKKSNFIKLVARESEMDKREVKQVLDSAEVVLKEIITKGEDLTVYGLGTFSLLHKEEKEEYSHLVKKTVKIPEKKTIKFKPSKKLNLAK